MKFLILVITVFSMTAWSQDEPINANDVNLKIGLSTNDKETEGTVSERHHATIERSTTGGTRATCPECSDPVQLSDNTAVKRQSGTSGAGQDDSGAGGP